MFYRQPNLRKKSDEHLDHLESERIIKFSTDDALADMGLADPGHAGGDVQHIIKN